VTKICATGCHFDKEVYSNDNKQVNCTLHASKWNLLNGAIVAYGLSKDIYEKKIVKLTKKIEKYSEQQRKLQEELQEIKLEIKQINLNNSDNLISDILERFKNYDTVLNMTSKNYYSLSFYTKNYYKLIEMTTPNYKISGFLKKYLDICNNS
jgi:predicted methyltransferase